MSATKVRIDLATARVLADRLVEMLKPACERIEIAGSIRRKMSTVGDIELVVIPRVVETPIAGQLDLFGGGTAATVKRDSKLDELLDGFVKQGTLYDAPPLGITATPAWGPKYKKAWTREPETGEMMQIDIFAATSQNWGAIFTIRTGPAEFAHEMQTHILLKTPYRQQKGVMIIEETGEIVSVPEEADYFRLAGIEHIRPESRTVGALKHAIAQARQAGSKSVISADQTRSDPQARDPRDSDLPFSRPARNVKATVVNIRDMPHGWQQDAGYVYIGRYNKSWSMNQSKWHNPIRLMAEAERGTVLVQYQEYLAGRPDLLRAVPELVGKTLVCWCAPKLCHGDVLAALANAYAGGRWWPGLPLPFLTYTDDESVRTGIRARLEQAAGL